MKENKQIFLFLPEIFLYNLFLFDSWEFKLHAKKVLDEKPDIFIIAAFEGFIPNILENIYRKENKLLASKGNIN